MPPIRLTSHFTNPPTPPHSPYPIGVLSGEGIGPEVIACALNVLDAVKDSCDVSFAISHGDLIGRDAERNGESVLPQEVIAFCRDIFSKNGAVLNGPGGGRYVYELRREFGLFCKLSPIQPSPELRHANRLKPEFLSDVDILMVRENLSGVYQGTWMTVDSPAGRIAGHSFHYRETETRQILRTAAALAASRRGHVSVIYKESGVPAISALWRDCANEIADHTGIRCTMLDIDHVAYRIIQHPSEFDVVVAPNMFGDVLSDLGGVLLGSRGLCYAGSFAENGPAVYSTNHGAAYDLAGTNSANPVAQILSLAMMLRESFALDNEAKLIENAIALVWQAGWRTADLMENGGKLIGTHELGVSIADTVRLLGHRKDISNAS